MNLSAVLFISGVLLSSLAGIMVLPLAIEFLITGSLPFNDFIIPIGFTSFIGLSLFFANKQNGTIQIGTADAFLLTSLVWVIVPIFAGLPFYFCAKLNLNFIDAWFEATSALTSTGGTIFRDVSIIPRWITIWRFLICYIGGVGMIMMGIVIFPILRIGGMHLFRSESSEKNEKIMASVSQMASWIVFVYSFAIIICFFLLKAVGIPTLDSFCHSISAIATCGLSIYNDSIMAWDNVYAEIILMIAMVFGGTSLLIYIKLWHGDFKVMKNNSQLKGYLKTLFFLSVIISVLRWKNSDVTFIQSIRDGFFNTISIITSSGFHNSDYGHWGSYADVFFILITFIGGCTGSTSGGIKIFRFQIIFASIKSHVLQLRRPHGVFIPMYDGKKITDSVSTSVYIFVALYLFTASCCTFILSAFGFDFMTSFSIVIASIGNTGPGMGDIVGPHCSLSILSGGAKTVLICCMILGKLELLTLLTLLTPSFWKK